jgi:hypothetical protein
MSVQIAFYRNSERIQTYRGSSLGKPSVDIYSCSGKLIRRLNVCSDQRWEHLAYSRSGTKVRSKDWAGLKTRGCLSSQKMARCNVTRAFKAILCISA